MKREYDVIIVGAGPAGLSIGSELSKKFDVLIIDKKNEIDHTTKSWFVPYRAVKIGECEEISNYLYGGIRRFYTNTYSGAEIKWNSHQYYPYINEKEILKYWAEICKNNRSKILLNTLCNDFKVNKDYAEICTTENGHFRSKILLDASGTNSFIKRKHKVKNKNLYYWSVYGAIVEFENNLFKDLKVGDYQLWQTFRNTNIDSNTSMANGRPIFEYEILDDKRAFIFIFFLKKDLVELDHMKFQFEAILKEKEFLRYFKKIKFIENKFGWYPSGGSNSPIIASDRISFVGDAGVWTTPCGWGMSTILANYKRYSCKLSEKIEENKLDKKNLMKIVNMDIYTENQFNIDQLVTHFLANSPSDLLDKFIQMFDTKNGPFKDKGSRYCEQVFTLSLSKKDIYDLLNGILSYFEISELLKVMPKRDIFTLLDTVKDLATATILDDTKKRLNKLFQKKIFDSKYEDGFTIGN